MTVARSTEQAAHPTTSATARLRLPHINVDQRGVFTVRRDQQVAGRFDAYQVTRFTNVMAAGPAEWDSLLVDFEYTLELILLHATHIDSIEETNTSPSATP